MPAARRAVMVEGVMLRMQLIPQRGPDQSRKAIRVQIPSGSFNACRRRELPRGDTRNRVRIQIRDSVEQRQIAKSSTMNGASSPCRSVQSETVPNREYPAAKGRGQLLYSGPRNHPRSCGWKLCRGGSLGHTLPDRALTGPTDVTDCATTINNRGRTAAAGVVPGARQIRRVIQRP